MSSIIYHPGFDHNPGLNYKQVVKMAKKFGINLMDEQTYKKIQKTGRFDENSFDKNSKNKNSYSWLQAPPATLAKGLGLYGYYSAGDIYVLEEDPNDCYDVSMGWRGMLRVPKA